MDIILHISNLLKNYISKNFSIDLLEFDLLEKNFEITINTDIQKQQFGDISTNLALILSKKIKKGSRPVSPLEIAKQIQENVTDQFINKIEIAGPGFINIFLNFQAIKKLSLNIFNHGDGFFKDNALKKNNYSIEFISANPTGPLHIGNGRGGVIGDVLGNVLKFLGYQTTKEFYINDAGSQIEKLGASFKIRCMQELGEQINLPEDGYHGEYLIHIAKECVKYYGQDLKNKSYEFFEQYAKNQILESIKKTVQNYGIHYDVWFSEKTLHEDGSIDRALKKIKNFLYEKDGALWFKSTEFGDDKDRVVKKSSGELTYVAADIAYIENKINRGANKLILVLGQDHHNYVVRLKAAAQALGYDPETLNAILYQLVTIKESGAILRLSKRAGKIITLDDIIELVGRDVARFFFLNKKADAHLDFDIDLAVKQTEENPVYYIQYAYVRTKSIINKAENEFKFCSISAEDFQFVGTTESLLIKKIASLKQLLKNISRNYQTHLLTYYILELAQMYHNYYAHNKVINLENKEQSRGRLFVTLLVNRTLKTCFNLLGISAPEKM